MSSISFFNHHPIHSLNFSTSFKNCLLHIFKQENFHKTINLNIILLTDDELLEFNKKFLNHDYYTDIITFTIDETDTQLEAELYISLDRVKENSLYHSSSFSNELNRVFIHGILHLIGYDDKTNEDQIEMRKKENFYLNSECFT